MRLQIFPLLAVCLICASSAAAQIVDEAGSTARILGTNAEIFLAAANPSPAFDARADLELIDPSGETRASVSQTLRIKPGKGTYRILMPIGDLASTRGDDLGWFRLRYRVGAAAGIVSVSALLQDMFELRASAPDQPVPGSDYRVRIRTFNPFTKANVGRVLIEAKLDLDLATDADEDEIQLTAKAVTNREGLAVVRFRIPPGIRLDMEPEIEVVARKNGVVRTIETEIESHERRTGVFFTADKPIYQPGETFNLRGLFLDANNTVIAGEELEIEIEDGDDTGLFRKKVTTSPYGIASISWKIPHDAKLGQYQVELDGDEYFTFKVTRYDLPNFTVTAEADKSFYLPADNTAEVTVTAGYLFGKPVTRGKVRVVKEEERRWNWDEQEYETDEGEAVEGETDGEGKYVARLDLAAEMRKLVESQWRRFDDLHFAAYFTDPTTNRTEEKRFDIRITKEPIHVYLIYHGDQHPELPMIAYVSTFYADGTPAVCSVELSTRNSTIDSFKTNPMGAGKFRISIPENSVNDRRFNLKISARDSRGQRGIFHEDILFEEGNALQIETDKAIYKPGDTVKVELASTSDSGLVYVDIVKDRVVIESRHVDLRKGKASLQFLYDRRFKGHLTIAAYTDDQDEDRSEEPGMRYSRGIIFPERQDMRLDAKFSKKSFRPGEDANVAFRVSNPAARNAESALGITIFDKAIEERARTDGDLRNYFDGFANLMGLDRAFGSTTLRDLNAIDISRPVPDEMQLAAEIILTSSYHRTNVYESRFDAEDAHEIYSEFFAKQTKPLERILQQRFAKDYSYPNDEESLASIVRSSGSDVGSFLDPWGQSYTPAFLVDRSHLILRLVCSGPDKEKGTPDDFVVLTSRFPYFAKIANLIDRAVTEEHLATGRHVRDLASLKELLTRRGIAPAVLTDPWKRPYRISFEMSGRYHVIRISSLGPDGTPATTRWGGDDFDVANISTDYFSAPEAEINAILSREVNQRKKPFPASAAEFRTVLRDGGIDLDSLRDGNGVPVYLTAGNKKQYVYRQSVENGRTVTTSAWIDTLVFTIRSSGSDQADASDDRDIASFSKIVTERIGDLTDSKPATITTFETSWAKGAIRGTIVDENGAAIPNAEVVAFERGDEKTTFVAVSDEDGKFLLPNLPSGNYTLKIASNLGFAAYRQDDILIRSQRLVEMEITLRVAGVSAMVDIASPVDAQDQTTNTTGTNITTTRSYGAKIVFPYLDQTSTPRLREYFPETLLWQPEVITDSRGRAQLDFKNADNITTWKMYAIASTKGGKVSVADAEFTTFQPFFVDLDPPKFLTEGDRISLPVQVRNYTDAKQTVDVAMERSDWFSFAGADRQLVDVDAGASKNAVFSFRADAAVKDGKQRVAAIAKKESDAIEKPITVRPNGKEIVQTQSRLFSGSEKITFEFPANALPGTARAHAKIYPNLMSHITDSVEGLLKRPYGCGEQTISSTYPNVMILKLLKGDSALRRKAQAYLKAGYERLIGYQVADGGFTYWGGNEASNIALTAYALRFLNDAKEFADIDPEIVRRAEAYLARVQNADGSWPGGRYGDADTSRKFMTTAYVARSIAIRKEKNPAVQKALAYLGPHSAEITDPYTLALYGLTLADAGDPAAARSIADRLIRAGVADHEAMYWTLASSTAFYGSGVTGQIETTALAVQLLTRTVGTDAASRGTLYLLRNKDRYGVWYSTQTTVNVLDALAAVLGAKPERPAPAADVILNGGIIRSIEADPSVIEPIAIDLTGRINSGANVLEIRGAGVVPLMVQTVATHYIAWHDVPPDPTSDLQLSYKCDRTDAAVMSEITCTVEAGQDRLRYGMMLAEIGLPPGADVSRESLDRAAEGEISRYDILPDRIVVYFWAQRDGTKFNFSFRPRYGIEARTPPSVVYDYYNPGSQATQAPLHFSIK